MRGKVTEVKKKSSRLFFQSAFNKCYFTASYKPGPVLKFQECLSEQNRQISYPREFIFFKKTSRNSAREVRVMKTLEVRMERVEQEGSAKFARAALGGKRGGEMHWV